MPDCFISYSSQDEVLAKFVEAHLRAQNVSVFMASISVKPGQNWSQEIWNNLRGSTWVIFLASRNACRSPYVQQELGGALATDKRLVPILWDMAPSDLPGWVNQKQALDVRGRTPQDLAAEVQKIARQIAADKQQQVLLIAGLIALGAILLSSK
jgi:ABC-type uncharacterized transport system substrate-binding protein